VDFVPSTTHGLNIVAQGMDWQKGDRIALPACEFPANAYPFLYLQKQGVEIDFIPHTDGVFTLEDVEKALTPKTKLLTLSWVQFLSGFKAPLKEIGAMCKKHGVFFCVDAIQGMGAMNLGNVEELGIDFLTGGVQKWMLSDQGLAYFYLSQSLQEHLSPPMAGWLGIEVDWDDFFNYNLKFYEDVTQFRIGTANNLGIAALEAAVRVHIEATPEWCESHILSLVKPLADGLKALGFERYGTDDPRYASGIVTVAHPRSYEIWEHLKSKNIEISYRNKLLRFAPTFYNTHEEIERTLGTLSAFMG
jgi:selenocysteine lyase/cysteine desulfurase